MKQEFFSREGKQPEPAPAETAPATPAETVPAEEVPAETPAETPETPPSDTTEDTPPGDTPPEETGDEPEEITPVGGKKIRVAPADGDEVGRLALTFMRRNRDMPLKEALAKAEKQLGVQSPADAAAAPADPDRPATVEQTTARLAELRAERRKANAELRMEDAGNLSEKIEDLLSHKSNLERQADLQEQRQASSAAATYNKAFAASEDAAIALYPAAADPTSALAKEMARIEKDLEENEDPLYSSPDKPKKIAQMAAANLNIAPRRPGAPAAVTKPAVPAPVGKPKSVLPGGGSRTTPPVTPSVPADTARVSAVKNLSELRALKKSLGYPDN